MTYYLFQPAAMTGVLCLSMLLLAGTALAKTPDGATPAEETVCDVLEDNTFGTCNAYCEAMDCDSDATKANPKACHAVLKKWNRIADGQPIPCESEPGISLLKKVNGVNTDDPNSNEIEIGESIIYTFDILNSGNVELTNITISDPSLDDEGISISCSPSQPIDLEIGGTATCTSDQSEAVEGEQMNTASVNGDSIYGEPVNAMSSTAYLGIETEPTCLCQPSWTDGEGAEPLSTTPPTGFLEGVNLSTSCVKPDLFASNADIYFTSSRQSPITSLFTLSCIDSPFPGEATAIVVGTDLTLEEVEYQVQLCKALLEDTGCSQP